MLKELHIQNIILVESATLHFQEGFHVFSGETGAGKTAILQALELLLGKRSDAQIIRMGSEKGVVEAYFEPTLKASIYPILKEAGIDIEDEDDLIIKREISTLGKSRIFINNQMAQLSLLKQIAPFLMEIVAQHATQKLSETSFHRELLDRFGKNLELAYQVKETHFHLLSLQKDLLLLNQKEERENALKKEWRDSLEEIECAAISSTDEEETLFEEYQKLSCTKELYDALSKAYYLLQESDPSILSSLKAESNALYKIQLKSAEFNQIQDDFKAAAESLTDLSFSILKYRDSLEENPEKLYEIDERLQSLRSLCKKYGPTLQDVLEEKEKLSFRLNQFYEISENKEELKQKISQTKAKLEELSFSLSQKRKEAKALLEKKIKTLFNELNLPNAELNIELTQVDLSENGFESVEFFLRANRGEKQASLKEKVSGGELSRVLLSLKVILSDLEEVPTLVFDEIDANLGGETAPKIGKLLKKMSEKKQILTITHLPQVAAYATHHFQIHKREENKRTFSLIQKLDEKQKLKEIERMLGGTDFSGKATLLAEDLLYTSKFS